jgi:hypothetical protein
MTMLDLALALSTLAIFALAILFAGALDRS